MRKARATALTLAAAGLCLAALPAQAMTVAEFLARAHALQARGILAIGSPEIAALRDEMMRIADAYRNDLEAARAAHRPPQSCPPPRGQAKMSSQELIAELDKIPPAQRGMDLRVAFYAVMKRRYPCR